MRHLAVLSLLAAVACVASPTAPPASTVAPDAQPALALAVSDSGCNSSYTHTLRLSVRFAGPHTSTAQLWAATIYRQSPGMTYGAPDGTVSAPLTRTTVVTACRYQVGDIVTASVNDYPLTTAAQTTAPLTIASP